MRKQGLPHTTATMVPGVTLGRASSHQPSSPRPSPGVRQGKRGLAAPQHGPEQAESSGRQAWSQDSGGLSEEKLPKSSNTLLAT